MADITTERLDAWVEPEIITLEIEETFGFPGRGGDGGRFFDCTRS